MLKDAISERDLDHLIAPTPQRSFDQLKDSMQSRKVTLANFDPLMHAYYAIMQNGIMRVGLVLLEDDDEGNERCPICFLTELHDAECTDPNCLAPKGGTAFDHWIERAADDAKMVAEKLVANA